MIGIYKITSPSNKIYIGQSINIDNRWKKYKYLNCKEQPRLYNSFIKYGVENHNFEVLLDFDREVSNEYLTHCEQFFMDYYREEGFELMNLKDAGPKGSPSEETKRKMSETAKNIPHSKRTESTKNKISETTKGVKKEVIKCPHCNFEGGISGIKRYHFNNCKKLNGLEKVKIYKYNIKDRICPHCNLQGKGSNMTRYHFNNCKNKNNN